MIADVDISSVAGLLGDRTRARIVGTLMGGLALPAGELARGAGVSASTASSHLAKLVSGGLLTSTQSGRHRYYRIANADVSRAIEALGAIAPVTTPRTLRQAVVGEALAGARTCYDHLAGSLGVAITDALLVREALSETTDGFTLGPEATVVLSAFGLDLATLPARRPAALRCMDWSERRPHVAGAVGAALCQQALAERWVDRLPTSRALRLTDTGRRALTDLGVIGLA